LKIFNCGIHTKREWKCIKHDTFKIQFLTSDIGVKNKGVLFEGIYLKTRISLF